MATCSSTLAWRIPWTEEPGRLQSMVTKSQTLLKQHSTQNYQKILKLKFCPPPPRKRFWFRGLEYGLKMCLSYEFPSNINAPGPGATPWEPLLRGTSSQTWLHAYPMYLKIWRFKDLLIPSSTTRQMKWESLGMQPQYQNHYQLFKWFLIWIENPCSKTWLPK